MKKVFNNLSTRITAVVKQLSIKNFLCLFVAGMINAFGVTVFLAPVRIYDGGISGTSMMLSQITPEFFSLSFFLIVLNVPLFLYGLKRQGGAFTIYAIYSVNIYSLWAWLITDVLPIDVSITSPLAGEDLLLCAVFGGLISGLGSGLAIRFGGAMDGIEVMAVIFAKRIGITVGTFVMVYNLIVYIICGFILHSWILPLYSILTYAIGLKAVDFVVEGFDRAKSAMVITSKPQEICAAVSNTFKCGVTTIQARGYYSNTDKTIVYIVVNRFQIGKLKEIVKEHDPMAYITVSEVVDVLTAHPPKK